MLGRYSIREEGGLAVSLPPPLLLSGDRGGPRGGQGVPLPLFTTHSTEGLSYCHSFIPSCCHEAVLFPPAPIPGPGGPGVGIHACVYSVQRCTPVWLQSDVRHIHISRGPSALHDRPVWCLVGELL